MQVTAEEEMTDLVHSCLPELDQIEEAFINDCCLREPRLPWREFSKAWNLSGKALTEFRSRVLVRLTELLASKNIYSIVEIV